MAMLFPKIEFIIYFIIGVGIFAVLLQFLLWVRRFLPHPESILVGTEKSDKLLRINLPNVKHWDLIYFSGSGLKICSCRSYLNRKNINIINIEHLRSLLANNDVPLVWKSFSTDGAARRFFFIGLSFISEEKYYIPFIYWSEQENKFKYGACLYDDKMKKGDVIVAIKSF